VTTTEASALSVGTVVGSWVAIPEKDGSAVKDGDALMLTVDETDTDDDVDEDMEAVNDGDGEKHAVALTHADSDGDALILKDPLEHAESDGDALSEVDRDTLTVAVTDGSTQVPDGADRPGVGHSARQAHIVKFAEPGGQYAPVGQTLFPHAKTEEMPVRLLKMPPGQGRGATELSRQ
jgi:hypothetical protein